MSIRIKRLRVSTMALAATAAFIIGFAIGIPGVINAHPVADHYAATWDADPDYYFGETTAPLHTSAAKSAMRAGATYVSSVSGSWLDFNWTGYDDPDVEWTWNACTTTPGYGLWLLTPNLGTLGFASLCGSGSTISSAAIAFDSFGPNWYTGVSTNVPSSSMDLRSISAHEFGHTTGLGIGATEHFADDDPDTDCGSSTRATMCGDIPSGVSYWRTLEEHDWDIIADAY